MPYFLASLGAFVATAWHAHRQMGAACQPAAAAAAAEDDPAASSDQGEPAAASAEGSGSDASLRAPSGDAAAAEGDLDDRDGGGFLAEEPSTQQAASSSVATTEATGEDDVGSPADEGKILGQLDDELMSVSTELWLDDIRTHNVSADYKAVLKQTAHMAVTPTSTPEVRRWMSWQSLAICTPRACAEFIKARAVPAGQLVGC
eukprot:TRINITY_DN62508_c0_g1_i2.p1 TRINITY_DN62508_c0_g1~~TRINITY_DN62508_c0_g1_i2.p1  ORF type:complete len:228 (+),score=37.55 TRINITY_DN62508_c0_g1_i2:78-686(+)